MCVCSCAVAKVIMLLSAGDQSESLQVIHQTINAAQQQLAGQVTILAFGLKTGLQTKHSNSF